MSNKTFFAADLHLGHAFMAELRGFKSTDDHDRTIIERWNQTVGPKDRVFVLGDLVMNRRCLPLLATLNGNLEVVLGNHDVWRLEEYTTLGIKKVHGAKEWKGLLLTHVPVHPAQLQHRFEGNVHGHLHKDRVQRSRQMPPTARFYHPTQEVDPRYLSVSLEQNDLRPTEAERVLSHFEGIKQEVGE